MEALQEYLAVSRYRQTAVGVPLVLQLLRALGRRSGNKLVHAQGELSPENYGLPHCARRNNNYIQRIFVGPKCYIYG